MAKLKGLLKIHGTLDDLTFYKTKDGHLVRTKGGVSGDRIANDPSFVRTRENGAEFGMAARAGKLLRNTVRTLMLNASDNRVTSRLTQLMTKIKNYDTSSGRGERQVAIGITSPAAVQLIKGFDFNNRAVMGSVVFAPYTLSVADGEILFTNFTPVNDLAVPPGATHVSLRSAYAIVDFANGTGDMTQSPVVNLPIDTATTTVNLMPVAVPLGTGPRFHFLMVEFFQEVNGVQYSLKNGAFNVLTLVDAS